MKVSVIVPMRNEQDHIAKCLGSLLEQSYPTASYEVIVVDGRSSDLSKTIAESVCVKHNNVRYVDNPAAIVPCAMNIGIRSSRGEIIIRADAHNIYPHDYIENCVRYLEQAGADNVGGPCFTVSANQSFSARLVAAILTSPFGVGDSLFRISSREGYVDTVPFGAFRRELFDRIGMYNEKLVRNQDNELNARIRASGGKIYQTPALRTEYHPVATFGKLLSVTFKTSQWHLFSMSENSHAMSVRHLAPALFVLGIIGLLIGSFFSPLALIMLVGVTLLYLCTGWYISASSSTRNGTAMVMILPFACLLFHLSYGLGTLAGARYLVKAPPSRPIREGIPTA
jgi:glycosyltransferase involved in cell wall biosynthesis